MDEIALHIDFLLHTHDCVIVPGLGGFVVNKTEIEKSGIWGLDAPSFELIFNSKLSYNDGLLAESIMKTNEVSYAVAIKQIETACDELRKKLQKEEVVTWTNLGTFKTDKENSLIFLPNKAYIRPQYFGLTNARLKPAALTFSATSDSENAIPLKAVMKYVSTAVAVAVIFFFVAVSYNNQTPKNQQAEIVSKPLIFSNTYSNASSAQKSPATPALDNKTEESSSLNMANAATFEDKEEVAAQDTGERYYIIVGVYEVRDVANKTLSTLKSKGYNSASMIERPRRLDVYSASFADKGEAQSFLYKFHKENRAYQDAWILKR